MYDGSTSFMRLWKMYYGQGSKGRRVGRVVLLVILSQVSSFYLIMLKLSYSNASNRRGLCDAFKAIC